MDSRLKMSGMTAGDSLAGEGRGEGDLAPKQRSTTDSPAARRHCAPRLPGLLCPFAFNAQIQQCTQGPSAPQPVAYRARVPQHQPAIRGQESPPIRQGQPIAYVDFDVCRPPARRSPLSFSPVLLCHSRRPPSVIPAGPPLSFPQVVSGNPVSCSSVPSFVWACMGKPWIPD